MPDGFSFAQKWRNALSSGIASNFAKKLSDDQVEPIQKIQWAFGDSSTSITQIIPKMPHISGEKTTFQ